MLIKLEQEPLLSHQIFFKWRKNFINFIRSNRAVKKNDPLKLSCNQSVKLLPNCGDDSAVFLPTWENSQFHFFEAMSKGWVDPWDNFVPSLCSRLVQHWRPLWDKVVFGKFAPSAQAWATMLGRHCVPMVNKINEMGQGCSSTVPTMDPHCPKVIT